MKTILVEYTSNNSGGNWWLKDKDWKNLEKAGWKIIWANESFLYNKKGNHIRYKNGIPKTKKDNEKEKRWLGTLAKYAYKYFNSIKDALEEFEKITKQDVLDEGCNCCGPPHEFDWKVGYCAGDSCSEYLYRDTGKLTKRELLESKK